MRIDVILTAHPIALRDDLPGDLAGRAGAVATFAGRVRGEEAGRVVAALEYEAYAPMAERLTREIVEDLGRRHPCLFVRVTHRLGVVPVGETAIEVLVAAAHRAEAFAVLAEFMDRLKQEVPIWKCRTLTRADLDARRSP
jgi:molybdopterin synthase catalytic subunit